MPVRRKAFITETLRKRIEHSLQTRALSPGDRLPSTREIGSELRADPRVVLAAYKSLADDGLVELRPRSGVYVAVGNAPLDAERLPATDLLADVLVAGVVRGYSLLGFTDALRIAAFGRTLRAGIIAGTVDEVHGLGREVSADYGLRCTGLVDTQVKGGAAIPADFKRAHLLIATKGSAPAITTMARELRKPVIVVNVRPVFVGERWKAVIRGRKIYIVAADPGFSAVVRDFLRTAVDLSNVKILVAGRDDVGTIPPQAPTFVTEAARRRLGKMRVPGQLIPPSRLLAEDTVRALVNFIVSRNTSDDA